MPLVIKKILLSKLIIVTFFGLAIAQNQSSKPSGHTNVILIMTDDQGVETVGAYGGESYDTPNIDRLAVSGIRFDQAHSLPVCTPTRIQLMTGVYNSRNYTRFARMPSDTYTFGNLFQDAGYATFMGGKWQLGGDLESPYGLGFDEYVLWQITDRPNRYANPSLDINGEHKHFKNGEYGPDIINDHVLDFINRHQDEKFFVYYPMILTHWPFDPTPDSPDWDPEFGRDEEQEPSGRVHDHTYFGDMVEYADKMVGKVIDKLEETGLRETTLVIFTGDNGTQDGVISMFNGKEYIGGKLKSIKAGTHVPLIANWPGVISEGSVNSDLIDFTYFFPTIAEVAGIDLPSSRNLDGYSIAPLLRGENMEMRDWLYMWWYRNGNPEGPGDEFARTLRYKYYHDGRFYDLEHDPFEEEGPMDENNLTSKEKEIRNRLSQIIKKYTREGFYN